MGVVQVAVMIVYAVDFKRSWAIRMGALSFGKSVIVKSVFSVLLCSFSFLVIFFKRYIGMERFSVWNRIWEIL